MIIAATHGSYPDFLAIGLAAHQGGRWVRFLTRHDVWNTRVARAMDGMRHVPVDRAAPAAAYLAARRLLREGEAVGIFPEAGISYAYAVRALMPGTAALARDTGAPIVPLALWGMQRIASVGRPVDGKGPRPSFKRGRRVDVAFGAPLTVGPDEDLVAATERLGQRADRPAGGAPAPSGPRAAAGGARRRGTPRTSAATHPTAPRRSASTRCRARRCRRRGARPRSAYDAGMTTPDPKATLVDGLAKLQVAVLGKLAGLSEYDLRRPVTPTGTNLLGVVKHLASVQAGYFGDTFGRPFPHDLPWLAEDADVNADMWVTPEESTASVTDLYRASWEHALETFDELELDATGECRGGRRSGGR